MKLLLAILQTATWIALSIAKRMPCGIIMNTGNPTDQPYGQLGTVPTTDPGAFGGAFLLETNENFPGLRKWPRSRSTKLVNIPYCYESKQTRDLFSNRLEQAINMWYDAFGGHASASTGHAINFQERLDGCGNPIYCIEPNGFGWNPGLSQKTLAIRWDPGFSTFASIGYYPPTAPFLNVLHLGVNPPLVTVAHELGHVFGLVHEHQRSDRDQHIIYRCSKLPGLNEALQEARKDFPRITTRDLCTDVELALRYDFMSYDFVSYPYAPDFKKAFSADGNIPYDVESIMHYPSRSGSDGNMAKNANAACEAGVITECSIAKRKSPGDQQGEYLPFPTAPSRMDIAFLKTLYPYEAP